jgi:hypothetical protein
MAVLSPPPKLQFFDANGVPLVGGKLYSYAAGTTTPLATYTSASETTFNTNPIILNSRGEAEVWLGSPLYKFKLTTAADVEIWTVDNIGSITNLQLATGATKIGYKFPATLTVVRSVQTVLQEGLSIGDFDSNPNLNNGVYDATLAMQRLAAECAANGYCGKLGNGQFAISGTILFDETGSPHQYVDTPRGSLVGSGSSTIIRVNSNVTAFDLRGGISANGEVGYNTCFRDFMLYRAGLAGNGTGIAVDNYAWGEFERIHIYGFDIGLYATDFLASTLSRMTIRNCKRGLIAQYSDFSRPNALTFADLELGINSEYGALITSPATLNWIGGAVEANGIGGTGAFGFQGGVKIVNGGTEGAAGVKFTSVYFEKNKGSADVNIDHTLNNCVYSFDTCTFNRIDSTDFVTNNISVTVGGTASIAVDVKSSGFQGYNSYVESAARRYIAVSGLSNASVTVDDATVRQFGSDTAFTDPATWGAAVRGGSVSSTGAALSLPRGWTSTKSSTGVYVVTHNLGTTAYGVSASANSINNVNVERVITASNSFTVVVTNTLNVLTDDAFVFTFRRN